MTENYAKPIPRGDGLNGEFYAFCRNKELRFQRCISCNTWRHMPREYCANCGSKEWEWAKSSGHGKLYTWFVAHRAFHPGFINDIPYNAVVIEMDEGVRMVGQIVDCAPDEFKLEMPVAVVFDEVKPGVVLPKFRLCSGGKRK